MIEYDPPLDQGIASAVHALAAAGIETFESCQGGEGHAYPAAGAAAGGEINQRGEHMRYNANPTQCPEFGGGPFPFSCRVTDAHGNVLPRVMVADLATGEVMGYALDGAGNFQFDTNTGEVLTYRRYFPAPLRLIPLPDGLPRRVYRAAGDSRRRH